MSKAGCAEGKKYVHCALDEAVHGRLYSYLLHTGGGKVRSGALGELVERAVEQYLDRHPVILAGVPEHDADAA